MVCRQSIFSEFPIRGHDLDSRFPQQNPVKGGFDEFPIATRRHLFFESLSPSDQSAIACFNIRNLPIIGRWSAWTPRHQVHSEPWALQDAETAKLRPFKTLTLPHDTGYVVLLGSSTIPAVDLHKIAAPRILSATHSQPSTPSMEGAESLFLAASHFPPLADLASPGETVAAALAAFETAPSVLPPGFGLGAGVAPTSSHYAEQPSPPYAVNTGYLNDQFGVPPAKRQRLSSPVPKPGSKKNGSPKSASTASPTKDMAAPTAVPAKSRRVRTGCLTCRERHLKCDEGTPDCLNCKKSNRECKRGVRLNFIDMTCKEPPFIPPTDEWSVQFQDESRLIASEYRGGLGRYSKLEPQVFTPPREPDVDFIVRRQSMAAGNANSQGQGDHRTPTTISTPQSMFYADRSQLHSDQFSDGSHTRKNSAASFMAPPSSSHSMGYANLLSDPFASIKDDRRVSQSAYRNNSDASTAASIAGMTGLEAQAQFRDPQGLGINSGPIPDHGMMTPPNDKNGEREYLNSPEELHFMQVFVSEVGIWMDSLDKEKHFSRLIPYHALKCPMLLNALLACGVKHLTLTQQYNDDKALFYYDTATTQLLRSLQNPERNTAECAATAVVLNVYEIMSEKPTQRMSHIAGARALIRECGWNAKSTGLGAACFWLNVGMELLSCLAFNWQTAWDPDQWGVDMDFSTEKEHGREEIWVHRIFHIVAKIANFRASIPKFQEPSPHDEQIRLQARFSEWQRLKNMCDTWNNACPRPMHPFGYLYPAQQGTPGGRKSLFPNVWLIKRAAIVGRLYYHTAQCLLAQINPILPKDSEESRAVQQHHAHQVCGIVAHTKDRGVASVSIRSLAIVAEVLTDLPEQQEVIAILENIDKETGWKLGAVVKNLKRVWDWEKLGGSGVQGLAAQFLAQGAPTQRQGHAHNQSQSQSYSHSQSHSQSQAQSQPQVPQTQQLPTQTTQTNTPPGGLMMPGMDSAQQVVVAPRPMRNVNPLSFADFSLPNHPYQNWYEPPSRSMASRPIYMRPPSVMSESVRCPKNVYDPLKQCQRLQPPGLQKAAEYDVFALAHSQETARISLKPEEARLAVLDGDDKTHGHDTALWLFERAL
ncbi:hypothetical protein JX266_007954 [Neoarthrinium moseri]|nr:hypothetical protein JX266_007954 [Neoarthrinium moseri]